MKIKDIQEARKFLALIFSPIVVRYFPNNEMDFIAELALNLIADNNYIEDYIPHNKKVEDKIMNDKIPQMTEEQARDYIKPIFNDYFDSEKEIESAIRQLKFAGHILPDPVEEAELLYNKWTNHEFTKYEELDDLCEKQHQAITYLKNKDK